MRQAFPPAATGTGNSSAGVAGALVAWSFGLAPVVLFLLTWTDQFTPLQQSARALGLPILAAELAITLLSLREGFRLPSPHFLPLALLVALGLVAWGTAVTAPFPAVALLRTGTWTIHLFFALALVSMAQRRMLDLGQLPVAVQTGFLLVFALLVIFVATTDQTADERIWGLPAFGNIRWFAEYAAGVVGLAASGFLRGNRFALSAATMAFILLFWTGGRGGIAAALAGMVACTLLFEAFRSRRVWGRLLMSLVLGGALSVVLTALLPIEGQTIARDGSSGRMELWRATIDSIALRPWFGWGDGQTIRFSVRLLGAAFPQPHNIVLQLLHAWGIVGTLLCLALAIWIAPRFVRSNRAEAAPFQLSALTIAFHSFVDGSLYHVHSVALFALCVAAAIAIGFEERDEREITSPA